MASVRIPLNYHIGGNRPQSVHSPIRRSGGSFSLAPAMAMVSRGTIEARTAVRQLLCRHYGRYVDDSTMIDPDREWLLKQVPTVREFLADELGLELHMGKLHIQEVHKGVEFLGTFVKPYRDYVSNKTLQRIKSKMQEIDLSNAEKANRTIGSYLGIMSHTASYNLRHELFYINDITNIIEFDGDLLKSKPIAA